MLKISRKSQLLVHHLFRDPSLSVAAAARLAGYSYKTAKECGHHALRRPEVRDYMNRLMGDAGLSREAVIAAIQMGMAGPDDLIRQGYCDLWLLLNK